MKILRLLFVFCLLGGLMQNIAFSQYVEVKNKIEDRGEAVVIIRNITNQQLGVLSEITAIDKVAENGVLVYLNEMQFQRVQNLGLIPELYLPYYTQTRVLNMANSIDDMSAWDKYPTWGVFQEMMLGFASDYPDICRLDTIGFSEEGRAILVVKISDNIGLDETEPEVFLSGQMHGDELVSYYLPLRMIDYLLSNYGSNEKVNDLVNNLELWINPLSNPDGTYGNSENDVSNATRYNANNVDLNRNFPDPNGNQNPDGNPTATENSAMMNFAAQRHFAMSANSHSGAEVLNYPWDSWEELHADDDWLVHICRAYADTVHEYSVNGYMTYLDDGITNGYAWYTTDGSRQDYFNYFEHCREVTFEWSNDKLLSSDELINHWNYNKNAMLNYFAEALEGIHGVVSDSITGAPLVAEILIEGHDDKNTQVYSELPNGDYHRYLSEGEWNLTFAAEGYRPKVLSFSLDDDETIYQDVQLVSLESLPPIVAFDVDNSILDCNGIVEFSNETQSLGTVSYVWDFGDGSTSTIKNPSHNYMYNGIYTVSLSAENENGSSVLVKENLIEVNLARLDSVHSASTCDGPEDMVLEAFGEGEIRWYMDLEMQGALSVGSQFEVPYSVNSSTYWARAVTGGVSFYGGESDNSQGGNFDSGSEEHYLIFDCFEVCTLWDIRVYAETEGAKIIWLKNSDGEVLNTKNISVEEGENTVVLDMEIPVGEDLRLSASADAGFFKGKLSMWDSFEYPYDIQGIIEIKDSDGSDGWSLSSQVYPYFYNWHIISQECFSEPLPVFASINDFPLAGFTYQVSGAEVNFNNISSYYTDLLWDFGDGNTSEYPEPIHTYSNSGEYIVSLDLYNECGHQVKTETIIIQEAAVETITDDQVKMYPNPANDILYLSLNSGAEFKQICIYDLYGRVVLIVPMDYKETQIDVSTLGKGVYVVRLYNQKGQSVVKKLIINK